MTWMITTATIKIWLDGMTEKVNEKLKEDLLELCEDNEEMRAAIEEYFENPFSFFYKPENLYRLCQSLGLE
jgi:transposase